MKASVPEDAPSPCIGVCAINPQTGYCEGCFRTLDEIAGWSSYSVEQKRAVLARVQERRQSCAPPRLRVNSVP